MTDTEEIPKEEKLQYTRYYLFARAIQQPDPLATAKLAASEWIATIKEVSRHLRTEDDRQPFHEQLLSRVFAETYWSVVASLNVADLDLSIQGQGQRAALAR